MSACCTKFKADLWNVLDESYSSPLTALNIYLKMWILRITLFLCNADMVTYLCCLTNRTSEPEPSKHAVLCLLTQCRVPECNERDILMAFHLFMCRKWRGTVTFWNGWQNKEPTLGKWLYLWFLSDRWRYQERDRVTCFWQFKELNDVMYGNILEHGGTRSYMCSL